MLKLSEHRRSDPVELTPSQQRKLKDWFHATLEPAPDGKVVVIPGSRVGGSNVDGLNVTVRPKLPVHRVLALIAESIDPYRWLDLDLQVQADWSVEDAVAVLFIRACHHTFSRGLHRSYRRERQDLRFVRGKILIPQTIRRPSPVPVAVEAEVFDDDVLENQVLAAALQRLRVDTTISQSVRVAAHREWREVRHVTELRDPLKDAERIQWSRHNRRYEPAIMLAKLVLAAGSIIVDGQEIAVPGFVVNMPAVVEQWARVQLRQAWALSEREMPDSWRGKLWLDEGKQIPLYPDLAVRTSGTWRFVGDVKYKFLDSTGPNQADVYQLLAYLTATGLPEGTLLHANISSGESNYVVANGGPRIRIVSIDLSQERAAASLKKAAATWISRSPQPTDEFGHAN
ncbi:McrC family protein [Gulosibacter chungangensis]|nr:McrC family protein [Gulosibacter chungangensis]